MVNRWAEGSLPARYRVAGVAKPTADVAIATQAPIASLVDPGANCTVVDGQATSLMDGQM